MAGYDELSLAKLGYSVTDFVARKFNGDREAAELSSVRKIARLVKPNDRSQLSPSEKEALTRLGLLVGAIPKLDTWSSQDKTALYQLIRAKGQPMERRFVLQCNRHIRFRHALENLARSVR
jgi:hypothetical protein